MFNRFVTRKPVFNRITAFMVKLPPFYFWRAFSALLDNSTVFLVFRLSAK